MNSRKTKKKIVKHLRKVQNLVVSKHKADTGHTICMAVAFNEMSDGFTMELHHNLNNFKDILRLMAISMIKEAEQNQNVGAVQEIWKEVMDDYREGESKYIQ